MFRIDHATASPTLPTPSALGTQGYFTEGDPGAGTPATVVTADFLNMLQEELRNVVVAGALTPSKTVRTQVRDALYALFPGLQASGRSAATPGYIRLPGGLILQWVRNLTFSTDASGQFSGSFTYPVAFTTAVLGASFAPTVESAAINTAQVVLGAPSLTQYPVYARGFAASATGAMSGFVIGV